MYVCVMYTGKKKLEEIIEWKNTEGPSGTDAVAIAHEKRKNQDS